MAPEGMVWILKVFSRGIVAWIATLIEKGGPRVHNKSTANGLLWDKDMIKQGEHSLSRHDMRVTFNLHTFFVEYHSCYFLFKNRSVIKKRLNRVILNSISGENVQKTSENYVEVRNSQISTDQLKYKDTILCFPHNLSKSCYMLDKALKILPAPASCSQ